MEDQEPHLSSLRCLPVAGCELFPMHKFRDFNSNKKNNEPWLQAPSHRGSCDFPSTHQSRSHFLHLGSCSQSAQYESVSRCSARKRSMREVAAQKSRIVASHFCVAYINEVATVTSQQDMAFDGSTRYTLAPRNSPASRRRSPLCIRRATASSFRRSSFGKGVNQCRVGSEDGLSAITLT